MTKEDRSSDPYGHPFVKLLDVKGKAFRIYVSDDGEFLTYVNRATGNAAGKREPNDHGFSEERINAVSIESLRKRLLKTMATHNESIRIPFWVYSEGQSYRYTTRHGTEIVKPSWVQNFIYGVHGSNDNALVEDEKGKKEQWASYNNATFRGDMPQDVRLRYSQLAIDEHKIQVAREKIEEEWKIDVRKVAQEAIEQVVGSA